MTGSGRLRDEARGERWEQSLVGVTGAVRRRDAAVRTQSPHPGPCRRPAPDSNRLHGQRQVRRRLTAPVVVPSVVLGLGLAGCTAAFALAPAATEPVALVCPAPVTVTWVDQYRDVLGLRVPDPRDRLEVSAAAGSTVVVTFTDADGAAYPSVRTETSGTGMLVVEPPRPVPGTERGRWQARAVVTSAGAVSVCTGALR